MRGWNVLAVFYSTQTGTLGPNSLTWGGGGGGGEGWDFRKIVYKAALFFSFNQKGNSFRHRLDHEFSLSNFLTIKDEEKNWKANEDMQSIFSEIN